MLASEALEILNASKITALIVTEASKPVGIVHCTISCARAWRKLAFFGHRSERSDPARGWITSSAHVPQ